MLGACAADPFLSTGASRFGTAVELADAPFFPQEAYQCGPAALATVLVDAGAEVTADELVPKVWLPARRGSLQPELLAASRQYGRIPYVIAPDFAALLAEVAAGHPVLVLQNLGISAAPQWHYAVVVGFSPDDGDLILRSGTDRRRVTPAKLFLRTWQRSDYWGMIALAPGALPADDDAGRYLSAVAAVEATGHLDEAATAYRAALERWPDSSLAHLGLGNTLLAMGRPGAAADRYRRALDADPDDVAVLNNLASVLVMLGRCSEAAGLIGRAEDLAPEGGALRRALADTRQSVADCAASPENLSR